MKGRGALAPLFFDLYFLLFIFKGAFFAPAGASYFDKSRPWLLPYGRTVVRPILFLTKWSLLVQKKVTKEKDTRHRLINSN